MPKSGSKVESGQELSSRQKQVAELASKGASNKEIAWDLRLAEGTVKVHMNDVFHKLNLTSRVQLVAYWDQHFGLRA